MVIRKGRTETFKCFIWCCLGSISACRKHSVTHHFSTWMLHNYALNSRAFSRELKEMWFCLTPYFCFALRRCEHHSRPPCWGDEDACTEEMKTHALREWRWVCWEGKMRTLRLHHLISVLGCLLLVLSGRKTTFSYFPSLPATSFTAWLFLYPNSSPKKPKDVLVCPQWHRLCVCLRGVCALLRAHWGNGEKSRLRSWGAFNSLNPTAEVTRE